MKSIIATFALLTAMTFTTVAEAAIKMEPLAYQAGTVTAKSWIIYDTKFSGKRPGVIVAPEWWGVTDYTKKRGEMLARLGYMALVADLYGDGKITESADEAGKLAGPLKGGDRAELRARMAAALEALKKNPLVEADKIAAIGYCFGGTAALELARSGANLTGLVSFHGGLDVGTAPAATEIKPKILVETGGEDPMVPPDQVKAFEDEMRAANANWEVNIYSGAQHAFTNPGADSHHIPGLAYNKQADERSWQSMKNFFLEIFKY